MKFPTKLTSRLALFLAPLLAGFLAYGVIARYVKIGRQADGSYLIPTGQLLRPAGSHVTVNDRPLGMALSPDGNILAVVTGSNFNPRALHLIDVRAKAVSQTIAMKDSFIGVAFNKAGDTIYVGGNGANEIPIFKRQASGQFTPSGSIPIPSSAPTGLSLSPDEKTLFVALNLKHTLGIVDLASGKVTQTPVGAYPYTTMVSPDGRQVWVSNWGGKRPGPRDFTDGATPVIVDQRTGIASSGTVTVIDAATKTGVSEIEVGLHPSGMAMDPVAGRVYVANANSDTVSVIDMKSHKVTGTLAVGVRKGAPLGSAPNALALSRDGKTLYVADGASNAIAVVDPNNAGNPVKGLIPTGWFPSAVAVSQQGGQLYVANGYGFGSIDPPEAAAGGRPDSDATGSSTGKNARSYKHRYGVVSTIDIPNASKLADFTADVRRNNRVLPPSPPARPNAKNQQLPVPINPGQGTPIKHVFFIIKENRTYDQIFGDLPQANGDPTLAQFGRNVTPNHHALAEQFVLMDNYYGPGDQSALGHRWCTQGYASDWVMKWSNARNDQNPMLFAPNDFIWDAMKKNGRTVRTYGERGLNAITPANATWTDVYNDWKNGTSKVKIVPRAQIVGLRDIYSPNVAAATNVVPDQVRADGFLKEFTEFEKNGNLPELVVLLLYVDHTEGTKPGFPTPRAQVADNDLALGRVVEAISKSKYWKESAIFVTEDDSQGGTDHVDGHRTMGLVISPYVRHGVVDSNFYTIINMFRTMEQILGLAPMNQFDLAAEPMFSVFTAKPDFTPYASQKNKIPLDEMNPPIAQLRGLQRELAIASTKMDFSEPDAAPADLLNRVIWHSVKGYDTPYPKNGGRPLRP